MSEPRPTRAGWLAVIFTIAIWTGFILVSRHGGRSELTGWDVTGLRFSVGALLALCFLPRVTLPPLRVIAQFTVFGGILYACAVYAGFRLAPAAHASVLIPGSLPFETALIAWLWLGQRPSRRQGLALAVVFIGIALTAADTLSHGEHLSGRQLLGDGLFLLGSSSWAVFTLLLRRHPMTPLTATVATALGCALVYVPVWLLFLPSTLATAPLGEIVLQSVYQGVLVVFIAMILYTLAVRQLGPQTVALLMAFVPGLSALAAVPVLGESLSALTLAGLAAVTLGALLTVCGSGWPRIARR